MTKEIYLRASQLSVIVESKSKADSGLQSLATSSIKDIDLDLRSGEKVWFHSDNPFSLEMLIRSLTGEIPLTSGSVERKGAFFPITKPLTSFIAKATLGQNLVNRGLILGKSLADARDYADLVMTSCDVVKAASKIFGNLPRENQILITLESLANVQPQILVLQQWMRVGNEDLREHVQKRLQELLDKSDMAILCMDKPVIESRVCNRKITLQNGTVVADESVS